MSLSASCPNNENSTECILRELFKLVEANKGNFNWDPITFGFTVPIATVATTLALVAILQAALAAGPGRRKSNSRAIGSWAAKTEKKWVWRDLNRFSVSKTPVLRSDRMLEVLKEAVEAPTPSDVSGSTVNVDDDSIASWLRLLQQLGLEDLEMKDDDLKATKADYLPSDLLAVPAYGEVGFIVAAAAAAGAYSMRTDSQSPYPVIIGDGFQFDFRLHPTLGTVGAFSSYGKRRCGRSTPSKNQLIEAIRHARGEVSCRPLDDPHGSELIINVLYQTRPDVFRAFSRHSFDKRRCRTALCSPISLLSREDKHHLLWFFCASTPSHPPATFPTTLSRNINVLRMLALNSKFWSGPDSQLREPDPAILPASNAVTWCGGGPVSGQITLQDLRCVSELILPTDRRRVSEAQSQSTLWLYEDLLDSDDQFVGFRDVFQACLQLLHDFDGFRSWFGTTYPFRQRYIRTLILLQIRQVDQWLKHKADVDGHSSHCRAVSLYCTTSTLLEMERDEEDGFIVNPPRTAFSKHHFRKNRSFDHYSPTLSKVHTILADFPSISEDTTKNLERNKEDWRDLIPLHSIQRHKKLLSRLLGIHGTTDMPIIDICVLLSGLRRVADLCASNQTTNTDEQTDYQQPVQNDGEDVQPNGLGTFKFELEDDRKEEESKSGKGESVETMDDMIIWRCILLALLFWTAPDSSETLSSGLWEHIIPII